MSEYGHHGPSKTRDMVSLVFSFFLALTLVIEAALLVVHVGVFTEGSMVSVLDDQYYGLVLDYVNDKAYYYTIPTGIAPAVTEDVFEIEDVHYDVDQYVLATLRGTEYEADTTAAEERLLQHVDDFFTQGGVELSTDTDEIAKTYVGEIMDIYRGVAKMPGLNALSNVRTRYMKYSLIGSVAVALLALVLGTTIVRLHQYPHRALRYIAYAAGGAGLMCFIVPFALYQSKWYLGLNLSPQYFYHFGTLLVARVLHLCMLAGLGYGVLMVVLALISSVMRQGAKARHRSHG